MTTEFRDIDTDQMQAVLYYSRKRRRASLSAVGSLVWTATVAAGVSSANITKAWVPIDLGNAAFTDAFWDGSDGTLAVSEFGVNLRVADDTGVTVPHIIGSISRDLKTGWIHAFVSVSTASATTYQILKTEETARLGKAVANGEQDATDRYACFNLFNGMPYNATNDVVTTSGGGRELLTEGDTSSVISSHDCVATDYSRRFIVGADEGPNTITVYTDDPTVVADASWTALKVVRSNSDPFGDVETELGYAGGSLDAISGGFVVEATGEFHVMFGKSGSGGPFWSYCIFDITTDGVPLVRAKDVSTNGAAYFGAGGIALYGDDAVGIVFGSGVTAISVIDRSTGATFGDVKSTITLTSGISSAQGIVFRDGHFYINSSFSNGAFVAREDGTLLSSIFLATPSISEDIDFYGDGTLVALNTSGGSEFVTKYTFNSLPLSAGGGVDFGSLTTAHFRDLSIAADLTEFTYAVSFTHNGATAGNRFIGGVTEGWQSANERVSFYINGSTKKLAVQNDGTLADTTFTPVVGTAYRLVAVMSTIGGTITTYIDGVQIDQRTSQSFVRIYTTAAWSVSDSSEGSEGNMKIGAGFVLPIAMGVDEIAFDSDILSDNATALTIAGPS